MKNMKNITLTFLYNHNNDGKDILNKALQEEQSFTPVDRILTY